MSLTRDYDALLRLLDEASRVERASNDALSAALADAREALASIEQALRAEAA